MYSWIASFFNETESTSNDTNLYMQQNTSQPKEEWTWIEVIEDREEDGLIIIQTDESTKNKNIDTSPNIVSKRKRRIQRSEVISRKVFKKSLYADLPLMRKACGKKLTGGKLNLNRQVKNLCKRTTSEVLSSTFPSNNKSLLRINPEMEFDVTYLLNDTTFLKSLLEGILKHQVQLDGTLQNWLESLVQSAHNIHVQQNQLAIDWNKRQPLCIEWYKDDTHYDADELEIIEVRYPLPTWMRRMNVVDELHPLPEYIKRINISAFHNACGEHHDPAVDFVENITYVPRWLRRMDVCVPYLPRDRHAGIQKFPSWMLNIDCDDEDLMAFPAWMNRIDLFCEGKENIECYPRFTVRRSKSWMPISCYSTDWIGVRPHAWIRPITSEMSLINNAQNLCNSMINFAMVLATATCTAAEDQCQKLDTIGKSSLAEKNGCFNQKKRRQTPVISGLWSPKSSIKKNKKWLNRVNNVAKLQSKRIRYASKSFSGRKCVRAC